MDKKIDSVDMMFLDGKVNVNFWRNCRDRMFFDVSSASCQRVERIVKSYCRDKTWQCAPRNSYFPGWYASRKWY